MIPVKNMVSISKLKGTGLRHSRFNNTEISSGDGKIILECVSESFGSSPEGIKQTTYMDIEDARKIAEAILIEINLVELGFENELGMI